MSKCQMSKCLLWNYENRGYNIKVAKSSEPEFTSGVVLNYRKQEAELVIGRGDKLENFDLNFFPTSKI